MGKSQRVMLCRYVLDRVRTLRQLDLKRISEDERKAASSERRREEAAKKAAEAQAKAEQERKDAILAMEVRHAATDQGRLDA